MLNAIADLVKGVANPLFVADPNNAATKVFHP
jgi:hypothetical protein